jgi:hypothetical protein
MSKFPMLTWHDLMRADWPTGAPPEAVNDNVVTQPQPDEIDRELARLEGMLAAFHTKRAMPSR